MVLDGLQIREGATSLLPRMNSDWCLAYGTETREHFVTGPGAKRFRARKLLSIVERALQYGSVSRFWPTPNLGTSIGIGGLGSHEGDL